MFFHSPKRSQYAVLEWLPHCSAKFVPAGVSGKPFTAGHEQFVRSCTVVPVSLHVIV